MRALVHLKSVCKSKVESLVALVFTSGKVRQLLLLGHRIPSLIAVPVALLIVEFRERV